MWKLSWNQHLLAWLVGIFLAIQLAPAAGADGVCSSTQFECDNGRCTSLAWQCDGEDDCQDGSDERNCTSTTCGTSDFKCKSDNKCIPLRWKCDKSSDCTDGSDEDPEECRNITCKADEEIKCEGNYCIHKSLQCDGQEDCLNGSDEHNCPTVVVTPTCPNNTFDCHGNGVKCIQYNLVCDGWNDCGDREDERTENHDPCPGDGL